MYTDLYLDVQAKDKEEACQLARESCGGDFIERPNSGDWQVHAEDVEEIES